MSQQLEVQISDASSLFDALRHPLVEVQLPTLRALMNEPHKALSYGTCQGQDVVDVLIELLQSSTPDEFLRHPQLFALCCYRDTRALDFLRREFCDTESDELAIGLANRLSIEENSRDWLRPMLFELERPGRAAGAASLLAGGEDLTPGERLRIALLLGGELPIVDAACWLAELSGPLAATARDRCQAEGGGLWEGFAEMAPELQLWLAERSAPPADFVPPSALEDAVATALLRRGVSTGSHWRSGSPGLQAAALAAGLDDAGLEEWLDGKRPCEVRLAALERLAAVDSAKAASWLLAALGDPDWEVRALVTALLSGSGAAELAALQARALDLGAPGARVAAIQVLLNLGQEDWLEDHILAPQLCEGEGVQ